MKGTNLCGFSKNATPYRRVAEIYEVFSMLIIAKDSVLTHQTSTQEYVVFNVSGWIISMGRCNSLA